MKRSKHKPARPHWERVVSRRSNGRNVTLTPEANQRTYFGTYKTFKEQVRPSNAKPGQ